MGKGSQKYHPPGFAHLIGGKPTTQPKVPKKEGPEKAGP